MLALVLVTLLYSTVKILFSVKILFVHLTYVIDLHCPHNVKREISHLFQLPIKLLTNECTTFLQLFAKTLGFITLE